MKELAFHLVGQMEDMAGVQRSVDLSEKPTVCLRAEVLSAVEGLPAREEARDILIGYVYQVDSEYDILGFAAVPEGKVGLDDGGALVIAEPALTCRSETISCLMLHNECVLLY
jgi:hypothetical protein